MQQFFASLQLNFNSIQHIMSEAKKVTFISLQVDYDKSISHHLKCNWTFPGNIGTGKALLLK